MENEDDFDGFDTRCIYMCVYVMCLDIYNVAYVIGSTYIHARRRKQLDVNYTLVREWLCRQLDCTEPLDSCTKRSTSTCSSTT